MALLLDESRDRVAGPRRSGTVLLVEDEEAVRTLMATVLRRSGFDVIEAAGPAAALAASARRAGPIDLLVTDVVMPEMTGPALAARIRAERPDVKIIFVSGYTDHRLLEEGALDPSAPFLQKPFPLAALLRKVRELLDVQGAA
jgi:CheY-like chemotaxis protein